MKSLSLCLFFLIAAFAANAAFKFHDTSGVIPELVLLEYGLKDQHNSVSIEWTSDFSTITNQYRIERSAAGNVWEEIGTVSCGISPNGPLTYSFTDDSPYAGLSRYRLVREDWDGLKSISEALAIVHRGAFGISIFPNPVQMGQPIHLRYEGLEHHEFQIEIVDEFGARIKRFTIESDDGANQLSFSSDVRKAGRYFVHVYVDDYPVESFLIIVK